MSRSGNGKNPCPLGEAFKVDDPLCSPAEAGITEPMKQREMIDASYSTIKNDFITALRIIYREGLSDAFAHLSARSNDGNEMMFMPRKSPALVESDELFFVDFEKPCRNRPCTRRSTKPVPTSKRFFHFHSPAVILLSVIGESIRPMHNYSAIFYQGVPLY